MVCRGYFTLPNDHKNGMHRTEFLNLQIVFNHQIKAKCGESVWVFLLTSLRLANENVRAASS